MNKVIKYSEITERFDARYHFGEIYSNSSSWQISDLKEIVVRDPMCYNFKYARIGIPIIRISDLKEPFLDFTKVAKITAEIHNKFSKTHLKPFDILVSVRGISTGKVGIFLGEYKECNISPNVIIIRLKDIEKSPYVAMYLLSNAGQKQIRKLISGAGKPSLTAPMINRIQIPIPAIEEIEQINKLFSQAVVQRLKSAKILSEIDKIFEKYFNDFVFNKKVSTIRSIKDLKIRWDSHYNNQGYLELRNYIGKYNKLRVKKLNLLANSISGTSVKLEKQKKYNYLEIGSINNISGVIESSIYDYPQLLPIGIKIPIYKNDILISKVRPYLNAISINTSDINEYYASKNGFAIFRPEKSDYPYYITAFLRYRIGINQIIMLQSGTSYPTVSENDIESVSVIFLDNEDTIKINDLYKEYVSVKEIEEFTKKTILDLLDVENFSLEIDDE